MRKKIYAAWFSGKEKSAVFYDSWEACKPQVKGVSGIRYRGFPDRKHAEEFLGIIPSDHGLDMPNDTLFRDKEVENTLIIYVDGSFQEGTPYAGWAWVALTHHNQKDTLVGEGYGITTEPALSRNIDGEITAVLESVKWVENYLPTQQSDWQKTKVVVLYDYQGIESWAMGKWKAKTLISQHYQKEMLPYRNYIHFHKVSAHSGKKWNEYVDRLAKGAIKLSGLG